MTTSNEQQCGWGSSGVQKDVNFCLVAHCLDLHFQTAHNLCCAGISEEDEVEVEAVEAAGGTTTDELSTQVVVSSMAGGRPGHVCHSECCFSHVSVL